MRTHRPQIFLHLPWLTLFVCTATSAGLAGTVTGTIQFEDRPFHLSGYMDSRFAPVRHARIFLYTEDLKEELDIGSTDEMGHYTLFIPESLNGAVRIVISAHSPDSPYGEIEVRGNTREKAIQSVASPAIPVTPGEDTVFDFQISSRYGQDRVGEPFNILDVLTDAAREVFTLTGNPAPKCVVYWEDGSTNGTYFSAGQIHLLGGVQGEPHLGDNDGYDDSVILHEYGHFLARKFSYDGTPGGSHSSTGYYIPTLTWSEGWATFWSLAVRNSPVYWDATSGDSGYSIDYETGAPQEHLRVGMNNESAVSMVLYDLLDGPRENALPDDDGCQYGLGPIWAVFSGWMNDRAKTGTLLDFYQGWRNTNSDPNADLIFMSRGIEFVQPEGNIVKMAYRRNLPVSGTLGQTSDSLVVTEIRDAIAHTWVYMELTHANPGALRIELIHPDGTPVLLFDGNDRGGLQIIEWYGHPRYATPVQALEAFNGKFAEGEWSLVITDSSSMGDGTLISWGMALSVPPSLPVPKTASMLLLH